MNYGSEFRNKSSSLNQGEVRRWLIESATIHLDFQKMDFHTYVNKGITFVGSNDIMMYARGKTYTIKHWLKGAPEIWAGLHDQHRNGDLATSTLNWNSCPLTQKQ